MLRTAARNVLRGRRPRKAGALLCSRALMRVTVLGAGFMGSAMAMVARSRGH